MLISRRREREDLAVQQVSPPGDQGFRTTLADPGKDMPLGPSSLSGKTMTDVTRILSAVEQGDPHAAAQLLPLVYDELRRLAAQRLVREKPGQTLEATALVHEAYLRLVGADAAGHWNSRGHFFAAAAEAMRRILIELARGKRSQRRGGARTRCELSHRPLLDA